MQAQVAAITTNSNDGHVDNGSVQQQNVSTSPETSNQQARVAVVEELANAFKDMREATAGVASNARDIHQLLHSGGRTATPPVLMDISSSTTTTMTKTNGDAMKQVAATVNEAIMEMTTNTNATGEHAGTSSDNNKKGSKRTYKKRKL